VNGVDLGVATVVEMRGGKRGFYEFRLEEGEIMRKGKKKKKKKEKKKNKKKS